MRIILVRNAEYVGQEKRFWAGKEIELSQNGKKQAQLLCNRLKKESPVAIYSSNFIRSIKTIEPLAKDLGLKIIQNSNFRSFDVGKYFGYSEKETEQTLGEKNWREMFTNPDPEKRYFEDGETLHEEEGRAWHALEEILRKHSPNDTIIISTHLTIINSILCKIINVPLSNIWFWGESVGSESVASITTIVFQNEKWFLKHYGCIEHLSEIIKL